MATDDECACVCVCVCVSVWFSYVLLNIIVNLLLFLAISFILYVRLTVLAGLLYDRCVSVYVCVCVCVDVLLYRCW